MFETDSMGWLEEALERLGEGFAGLPAWRPAAGDAKGAHAVMAEAAERLQDNFPYFHPLYAGQMLKPPHPVARAAYTLATWINPNNHARDGGRASSQMEIEAVSEIAAMFGWPQHLGHLTSGGTFANLEALWVAGQMAPGKTILASEQAHYTHQRISGVLRLPFEAVPADARGRLSLPHLRQRLEQGDVGTVVATLGTTALGAVDPLPGILTLREQYGFCVHVDAAYGGYFGLAGTLDADARAAFDALGAVDSLVIDPHKHGLQPYGCGCILFRDPAVGRFYNHDSPYTYFTSQELHLGEISLECSRAGASAVALWATQRLLPLVPGGAFAGMLADCRAAALELHRRLQATPEFVAPIAPELDIVVWAVRGASAAESSLRARQIFEAAAQRDLHLALVQLPVGMFPGVWPEADAPTVACLRSVLMKPEHRSWMDAIWERLVAAVEDVVPSSSGVQA
jgi:tyrosine decarboxylase/aspartate 1-decarboxylase